MIEINPIDFTPYQHKYLTVVSSEQEWNDIKSMFEECNYTVVKASNNTPDEYQPSYKTPQDALYRMLYNNLDETKTTFFLEILWGYFGWEWKDYEYIPENYETDDDGNPIPVVLKGGNLFKNKEITEVTSIPDGYRLQHINDFINSQDKVNTVNTFDTSNIITANRAFKTLNPANFDEYRCRIDYVPINILIDSFPNAEEIKNIFSYACISLDEDAVISFPKATKCSQMFKGAIFENNNVKVNIPLCTDFSSFFEESKILVENFNFRDCFTEASIVNVNNFNRLFYSAVLKPYDTSDRINNNVVSIATLNIPLTGLSSDYITAESICSDIVGGYNAYRYYRHDILVVNLRFDKPINLKNAFWYSRYGFDSGDKEQNIRNFYWRELRLSFTNEEKQLIDNVDYAFKGVAFENIIPITQWNGHQEERGIYNYAIFNQGIHYDFSPNHTVNPYYSQFRGARIKEVTRFSDAFENVKYLKHVDFREVQFDEPVPVDVILCDPSVDYGFRPADNTTEEGKKYRPICFGGSNISTVVDQNIYYEWFRGDNTNWDNDDNTAYGWNNRSDMLFNNCPNLDFPNNNLHIYRLSTIGENWYNVTIGINNCPSLTETPYYHFNYNGIGKELDSVEIAFRNDPNLRIFHGNDINVLFTNTSNNSGFFIYVDFNGCPNLETLELGRTNGLRLTVDKCHNINPNCIKNIIMKMETNNYSIGTEYYSPYIQLHSSTYNRLDEETINYARTVGHITFKVIHDE